MHIALVSYECPPDTALGGIGTYTLNAARQLAKSGHSIEVFSASLERDGVFEEDDFVVHRVKHDDPLTFRFAVVESFMRRHAEYAFDVVEGPEYHAEASEIIKHAREIPLVVRLHTPNYLVRRISARSDSKLKDFRVKLGNWRRGRGFTSEFSLPIDADERLHATAADLVVSPSTELADIVARDWGISRESIIVHPNIFVPLPSALSISPGGDGRTVLFVGRIESRKGVHELAMAVPKIVSEIPGTRFVFAGRISDSGDGERPLPDQLKDIAGSASDSMEFIGQVSPDRLTDLMRRAQICIFPSRWENFGNVCLEAMAAARAIIASNAGGFADMLDNGSVGILIPPNSPDRIVNSVVALLRDPERCVALGSSARARLLSAYDPVSSCAAQVDLYQTAIDRRKRFGVRAVSH